MYKYVQQVPKDKKINYSKKEKSKYDNMYILYKQEDASLGFSLKLSNCIDVCTTRWGFWSK